MSWLDQERNAPPGLKVVDWKPEPRNHRPVRLAIPVALAAAIGVSAETVASLFQPNFGHAQA